MNISTQQEYFETRTGLLSSPASWRR